MSTVGWLCYGCFDFALADMKVMAERCTCESYSVVFFFCGGLLDLGKVNLNVCVCVFAINVGFCWLRVVVFMR